MGVPGICRPVWSLRGVLCVGWLWALRSATQLLGTAFVLQ